MSTRLRARYDFDSAMTHSPLAADIARQFQVEGELAGVLPYGSGHINDTYCAVYREGGRTFRRILQRVNTRVFRNPAALMENIARITTHLALKQTGQPDCARRALALIPARDGRLWHVDAEAGYWRMYRFIEGARTFDAVESTAQAFQAAQAFGSFQRLLADLPAPPLHAAIPDFHNTPKRLEAFEAALAADAMNRAAHAKPEIDFALAHGHNGSILLDAQLPERVTHNDTKFNNVLLDEGSGEALCVIDLDTAMPGLALYDFGDMVRTTTSPAMEDERDLSRVTMQMPMFEALLRGYLSAAGGFLTPEEKNHLAFSGKLMAFEQGIRFLADYLAGDAYYKVHRTGHNLDRCRAQFRLVDSIAGQEDAMNRLVDELAGEPTATT